MSYDPLQRAQATPYAGTRAIDPGLQSYMQKVYNTMGLGLVVTGLVAFAVAQVPELMQTLFNTPLKWVVMFAPLAFIFFGFSASNMARLSVDKLTVLFTLFSALMGLSMASIFIIYTDASIARAFFVTAAMFAGVSLWGYTTKKDLTGMGSFMMMGLVGLIIASVVNIFLGSAMVHFVTSALGVIVFTGLAAWETQQLKETYAQGQHEANAKMAVVGALGLYMSFINLFQSLLHLLGNRE